MITTYTKKRYKFYILLSILALVLPFIKINEASFFLLDFTNLKLDLFFNSYTLQELYLLPFVLIFLFLFIFLITTVGGRVWCAWSCPQTIFRVIYRDLIQTKILKINKSIKNKQTKAKTSLFKKILAIVIFYLISLLAVSNFLWYFVSPYDFFQAFLKPDEHVLLFSILFVASFLLTLDITYLAENFCIYVCPYARIQSVMFDEYTLQVIYNQQRGGVVFNQNAKLKNLKECTACEACVKVCPTHIDIRKGMQLECINCLECADACSAVQSKFGRESLIQFSSSKQVNNNEKTKLLRFRSLAYLFALCLVFVLLVFMASKKEKMLLNINRTSELYSISNGSVLNAYTFLFENTDTKEHKYYFKVYLNEQDKDFEILRPSKAFSLKAGERANKIVVLKALKDFSNPSKDNILKIKIYAYSLDDDKIKILRNSIFIYPKAQKQ